LELASKKLDFNKTCSFTGHRIIPNSDLLLLSSKLPEVLEGLIKENIVHFICGGAIGFDTLAAQEVLKLKKKYPDVTLELALPCKNQAARWNKKQTELYESIKASADKVTVLFDKYITGCCQFRDAYMVDNSDVLVAYYRGKTGGTQYTLLYAERRGIKTVIV